MEIQNGIETKLSFALNLYENLDRLIPSKSDERLSKLSTYLRQLPFHCSKERNATFRNVASVRFKLQNLNSVIIGGGFKNSSKMDQIIAQEYLNKPMKLKVDAERIISGAKKLNPTDFDVNDIDEFEFYEGRIIFTLHKKRERNQKLRHNFLKRYTSNSLSCDNLRVNTPRSTLYPTRSIFRNSSHSTAGYGRETKTKYRK